MRRHKSSSPSVSSCSSETEGKEVREKLRAELALELDPPGPVVAKMASHAIFQYNVLAIDDIHNTWTNMIVKDEHSQAFRFK